MWNNGNGTFTPTDQVLSISDSEWVDLADPDGDGDLDVLISGSANETASILFNSNVVDLQVAHTTDTPYALVGDFISLRTTVTNVGDRTSRQSIVEYSLPDVLTDIELVEAEVSGGGKVFASPGQLDATKAISFAAVKWR